MNATPHFKNNRILVIDDNRSICEDIRKILCGHKADAALQNAEAAIFDTQAPVAPPFSFHVECALQGEQGLRMVEAAEAAAQPYAMAFIDMHMPPGWDGVETLNRLWQRFPALQVVLCTAYSDFSWEKMIRAMGRSDSFLILKKPFDSIEVLQMANALTQKWSLQHEVACRLWDLDQLVAQRTLELQSANERLKKEIAEQARLEKQLRQAQKMEAVGQLASGVAHDFNNILTVVQGNASLLLSGKSPESPDCRALNNICSVADRASKLVGQLRTFCRKQAMDLRPTQMRDTLARVAETMPRVLNSSIKVDAHASPNLPMVSVDGPMMETLFNNLASNARDAMPEGGILCLTATSVTIGQEQADANPQSRPGTFVRLSVSDTGIGIPPENLARVFEPFFTTKPMGKGAGLGLAIVYGIVQQHQGWVEVNSQVNHGTAFHIYIPAMAAVAPRQTTPTVQPAKAAPARETVLVVDDEPDLRDLVSQVLETGGYKVLCASSGAEALEKWAKRTGDVHLLLTDIVMPDGFTGRKLAERLQSEDAKLKVIYTSGYTIGMAGTELANVDERSFLAKPYRPSTLLKVVRECLDQTRAAPNAAQKAA